MGIRDESTHADAEAEVAGVARQHIEIEAPPFDLDDLCRLHRQLFGDVYEWAGNIRSVDVSKGTTRFCTSGRIVPEANRIMQLLGSLDLSLASRSEAIGHVAECFGELNLRSEEHTSELQSLMRNSYAVFCLKKKQNTQ